MIRTFFHPPRKFFPAVLLALTGCAAWDVHEVRDPQSAHAIIGRATVPDLILCMGNDYAFKQTKPDEGVLSWTRKDTSTTLKASVTLLGSVELGGGGGCTVNFDVLRDGTVADADFSEVFNDGLLAEPYHACKPLVRECLSNPGSSGLPRSYDAFAYLLPEAKR